MRAARQGRPARDRAPIFEQGNRMQNTKPMAMTAIVIAAAIAASATAHAQTRPIQPWQPPKELDPAKRVPQAAPAQVEAEAAAAIDVHDTDEVSATQGAPAGQTAAYAPRSGHAYETGRGGFFIGL